LMFILVLFYIVIVKNKKKRKKERRTLNTIQYNTKQASTYCYVYNNSYKKNTNKLEKHSNILRHEKRKKKT